MTSAFLSDKGRALSKLISDTFSGLGLPQNNNPIPRSFDVNGVCYLLFDAAYVARRPIQNVLIKALTYVESFWMQHPRSNMRKDRIDLDGILTPYLAHGVQDTSAPRERLPDVIMQVLELERTISLGISVEGYMVVMMVPEDNKIPKLIIIIPIAVLSS